MQVKDSSSMRFREFEDSSAAAGHASQRIVGDERRQPGLFHDQLIDVAQQCTSTRKHDTALRHIAAEIRRRLLERLPHRTHDNLDESLAAPTTVQPAKMPLERLREWQGMAEGAYSANTVRAQKADGAIFQAFCEGRGESFLPADATTIRAFIEHAVTAGKKPATVRRYIATIGRAHIGAGLLNPCSGEAVRLALKKMGRETSARQAQARALGWKRSRNLLGARARGSGRIASAHCSAWRTKPAGSSWRLSCATLSSGRTARATMTL
jgi:hypothetical protein